MDVIEKIRLIEELLRQSPAVPFEVIESIKNMIGFDGCECQIEEWWYSPSTDSYFSRKYGCGSGSSLWDRAILHIIFPVDEGGDRGFWYRALKEEYADAKFVFNKSMVITIPNDLIKI